MLYMPANKDFLQAIISRKYPGLTAMTMCFEDACREEDVAGAEQNAVNMLVAIKKAKEEGVVTDDDLPLIFFRVRNPEQYKSFTEKLDPSLMSVFSGLNFPRFNTSTGNVYFDHLCEINAKNNANLYGMPILEGREIALIETRHDELIAVKELIDKYKQYVLNVRVGATDFSSTFGTRRGIDYTIYDILTVRACLSGILNTFSRDNDYVISGPVWEYFHISKEDKFRDITPDKIQHSLFRRETIINEAVDGLLREVILDKANGFVGKTVIHPTHLRYVNAMQAVTREKYEDAMQILNTSDGVVKSAQANKMNEIRPHTNWAVKVVGNAKAYGVIEDETHYTRLFTGE